MDICSVIVSCWWNCQTPPIQNGNDCSAWASSNGMLKWVYNEWVEAGSIDCPSYGQGYCSQFGLTRSNWDYDDVYCCIWNCEGVG